MNTTLSFKDLGINEPVLRVCREEGFIRPTEIQEKSIPYVLDHQDVIGEAATGSGKTLAFATGIIHRTEQGKGIQSLVLTPTRELAHQVADMITMLSKYKKLNIVPVYGGVSINSQIHHLRRAEVVVATPGRLIDHIQRKSINLQGVKVLVIDECDRLLDMGFLPDIEYIISILPKKRQTLLFSATISYDVNKIAYKYQNNPIEVNAKAFIEANKLSQVYFGPIEDSLKFSLLVWLLEQDQNKNKSAMIFCNTRRTVDFLFKNLTNLGFKASSLHGGYSQSERSKQLNRFIEKRIPLLIATDVAARGLDIPNVQIIYNYDLPNNGDQYIHRIGRTARAGKSGRAITLVTRRNTETFMRTFRSSRFNILKEALPHIKRVQTTFRPSRTIKRHENDRFIAKRIPEPQFSRYSV